MLFLLLAVVLSTAGHAAVVRGPGDATPAVSAEQLIGSWIVDSDNQPLGRVQDVDIAGIDHRVAALEVAGQGILPWSQIVLERLDDGVRPVARGPVRQPLASDFADRDLARDGLQSGWVRATDILGKDILLAQGVRLGPVADLLFTANGRLDAAETWLGEPLGPPRAIFAGAVTEGYYRLPIPAAVPLEPDLAYLPLPYTLAEVRAAAPRADAP
jgi:sporulation protein YlmC with PRC-barrel domain